MYTPVSIGKTFDFSAVSFYPFLVICSAKRVEITIKILWLCFSLAIFYQYDMPAIKRWWCYQLLQAFLLARYDTDNYEDIHYVHSQYAGHL